MRQNDSAMVCESVYEAVERVPAYPGQVDYGNQPTSNNHSGQIQETRQTKDWLGGDYGKKDKSPAKERYGEYSPASSKLKLTLNYSKRPMLILPV